MIQSTERVKIEFLIAEHLEKFLKLKSQKEELLKVIANIEDRMALEKIKMDALKRASEALEKSQK